MCDGAMLALETSTATGSVAAWAGGRVVFSASFTSDRSHNSRLFGPLGQALAALDVAGGRGRLRILVGTGPGSYAGTRVGLAAAQGVAVACGCPVVGVPSLLALPEARQPAGCLAVGDARRGAWWTARVAPAGRVTGPELCGADDLARAVAGAAAAGIPVVAFDPPHALPAPCATAGMRPARPSAERLLESWRGLGGEERRAFEAAVVEPCYLRPPHVTVAKKRSLPPGGDVGR